MIIILTNQIDDTSMINSVCKLSHVHFRCKLLVWKWHFKYISHTPLVCHSILFYFSHEVHGSMSKKVNIFTYTGLDWYRHKSEANPHI